MVSERLNASLLPFIVGAIAILRWAPRAAEPSRTLLYLVGGFIVLCGNLAWIWPNRQRQFAIAWVAIATIYNAFEFARQQAPFLLFAIAAGAVYIVYLANSIWREHVQRRNLEIALSNTESIDPNTIEEVLAIPDDSQLCIRVFDAIVANQSEEIDASRLNLDEQTVLLPVHAKGIIGNGGFNYLFEGEFKGDPYFELTAAAFERIGASKASRVFRDALTLFPNSRPPRDLSERLRIYRSGKGKNRADLDQSFWQASAEIDSCLAKFIRAHRTSFLHLQVKRRELPQTDSLETAGEIHRLDLASLPHWARIALAARCARRVVPIFKQNWPNALPARLQSVERAIALAEQSAAEAQPAAGLADAVLEATMTAGAALRSLYGMASEDDESLPADGNLGTLASTSAKAASRAAEAAAASPNDSAYIAADALDFALSSAGDLASDFSRDFERLVRAAATMGWTNRSAVPIDFW